MAHFPFSPSDMVLRRNGRSGSGFLDEYHVYVGEDLDINVRWRWPGAASAALTGRSICAATMRGGDWAICRASLPTHCARWTQPSPTHAALRPGANEDQAYSIYQHALAAIAFGQEETAVGQEFARAALQRDPRLLLGHPSPFLAALIAHSCVDESVDHDALLRAMLDQLPLPQALGSTRPTATTQWRMVT
ncbi:MAG: hypothetical protein R3A10_16740 [Caldilineaceae bacterium]